MLDEQTNRLNVAHNFVVCLLWLALYGLIGVVVLAVILHFVDKYAQAEAIQQWVAVIDEQIKSIKAGEVDCLVHPEPESVDKILSDVDCAKKINTLYMGGDISDERLARLKELPNLKCIIFLHTKNPDAFLECIRGLETIEALDFPMTHISHDGLNAILSLPNLKTLSLSVRGVKPDDLERLTNRVSLKCILRD